MSLTPGHTEPARFGPTWALQRSVILGVALGLLAALARDTRLAVLALPFLVPAGRALARHAHGTWRMEPVPPAVAEGDAVTVATRLDGTPTLVTLALDGRPSVLRRPALGTTTGVDGASVDVEPVRWGRHELGRGQAVAVDPSGSWRSVQPVNPGTVRVRPAAQWMTGGSGVRLPLGIQGSHLSPRHGEGTELAEVREYRTGDRLRRITWNRSSRSDDLFVVDAFTERDTDVLVVIDAVTPAQPGGEGTDTSLDVAVRATLALAGHYLAFGDRVGVHDLGGRVPGLQPGSGPRQLVALNEMLSAAPPPVALPRVHPVPGVRSGMLVFVCTPLLDDAVVAELGRLRRLGAELVVVDTLPQVPRRASTAARSTGSLAYGMPQAWRMRAMRRQPVLDGLHRVGLPVARWEGPASLAAVLQAMQQARAVGRVARR